jgi:DNA-binding transcriptional MerR regulator
MAMSDIKFSLQQPLNDLTLELLAEQSGVPARTIRNWIQRGLLSGPQSRGRNARYGPHHVKRLIEIKRLRDEYGMGLDDIRRQMTLSSPTDAEERFDGLPDQATLFSESTTGTAIETEAHIPRENVAHSALETLRSRAIESDKTRKIGKGTGAMELLLKKIKALSSQRQLPRKSRGEEWIRVPISPEIELHVQGHLTAEQLSCMEQLADYMREILIGGDDTTV